MSPSASDIRQARQPGIRLASKPVVTTPASSANSLPDGSPGLSTIPNAESSQGGESARKRYEQCPEHRTGGRYQHSFDHQQREDLTGTGAERPQDRQFPSSFIEAGKQGRSQTAEADQHDQRGRRRAGCVP